MAADKGVDPQLGTDRMVLVEVGVKARTGTVVKVGAMGLVVEGEADTIRLKKVAVRTPTAASYRLTMVVTMEMTSPTYSALLASGYFFVLISWTPRCLTVPTPHGIM